MTSAVETVVRPAFSRVSHRARASRIARPGTSSDCVVAKVGRVEAPVSPKTAAAALAKLGHAKAGRASRRAITNIAVAATE